MTCSIQLFLFIQVWTWIFFLFFFPPAIIGPHCLSSTERSLSQFDILDSLCTIHTLRHFVKLMSKKKQIQTLNKLRFPAVAFPCRKTKIYLRLDQNTTLTPSKRVRKILEWPTCSLLFYVLQTSLTYKHICMPVCTSESTIPATHIANGLKIELQWIKNAFK